jgi:hypothetical protein
LMKVDESGRRAELENMVGYHVLENRSPTHSDTMSSSLGVFGSCCWCMP